jgi:ParB family chromosome partitioning protein
MKTEKNFTRGNLYNYNPMDLVLVDNEDHELFDPRINLPLDEGLVRNVMVNGVIEPVVVTKAPDGILVVDGRQRVRAAREANKRLEKEGKEPLRVSCVLRRGTEADLFGVSISANENRQDDTPLGRAEKANRLLNMGRSEDEVAIAFGVSTQCVGNWIKLLSTCAPVRKAVESGKIAAQAAIEMAELPVEEQKTLLEEAIKAASTNGKRVSAKSVKDKVAAKTGKTVVRLKSRKQIEEKLKEKGLDREFRKALRWVLNK